MKTRRTAIVAALSFGALLAGLACPASAGVGGSLMIQGSPVADSPVLFSGTGLPNSTARIVVVPMVTSTAHAPTAFAVSSPEIIPCYTGVPTALGTADVTTDSAGNFPPTVVWPSATAGFYEALLLQGPCASGLRAGTTAFATTDQRILAQQGFDVVADVPALSLRGLALLGLALSVAGWGLLRTRS